MSLKHDFLYLHFQIHTHSVFRCLLQAQGSPPEGWELEGWILYVLCSYNCTLMLPSGSAGDTLPTLSTVATTDSTTASLLFFGFWCSFFLMLLLLGIHTSNTTAFVFVFVIHYNVGLSIVHTSSFMVHTSVLYLSISLSFLRKASTVLFVTFTKHKAVKVLWHESLFNKTMKIILKSVWLLWLYLFWLHQVPRDSFWGFHSRIWGLHGCTSVVCSTRSEYDMVVLNLNSQFNVIICYIFRWGTKSKLRANHLTPC